MPKYSIMADDDLTMDKATGLGNRTEKQFLEAVRYGRKPDGTTLSAPMAPHWILTNEEVKAIWAYLQTLPPVEHARP